ncbi:MAG TPA: PAS domain S-box protein [Chthonomonadaceae bacterium]|nr:PAS domain S-box protein [Chthonomonadaceae bacterium]
MSANKQNPGASPQSSQRSPSKRENSSLPARADISNAVPEVRLSKLNRTYALVSDVNQTIASVHQTQELFETICRSAIEQGGFRMAWIGLIDPQTKQVKPAASAGEIDSLLEKQNMTLDDSVGGFTAAALRTGEHVVIHESEGDPNIAPWRADALQMGYRASAVFPLMVAGEVRGTLNVYAAEPDFFGDDQLTLLDEMAADIAFALEFIAEDEQRRLFVLLLRESEERYHTLARISPVGIFRADPNGATTYVNPAWCAITGLSYEKGMGMGWLDAIHPDDKETLSRNWQQSTYQGRPSYAEYRFVRPDGTVAWVMGQAVPELNSEQQIIGYVGTVTDITERKRAEAALQASERQHSLIFASISDILFYIAVEAEDRYRFLSVNSAFLKATGLTEGQVIGKLVQEVIPEPAHALVLEKYREALRAKKAVHWEEVSVYPAGKRHGEVSVTPILGTDGNCTHLIGAVHDVTERVRAEAELHRLNAELEERVAQRTEELRDAMIRAQDADRMKSAFLATMSHELRTPLNSIIGFTGVLLQELAGPLNAEQSKQLGMTRDSARHLLALINDVLDISKIEAGQLEVARAPFEIRATIEDTLRTVSPQAQKKGLALAAAIAPGIGVVVSDRRRVEQILLNLLSNAIKFTERGEVRLECRMLDRWLEISVTDTGIGIRPEDLGRLFEPFQQLESGLNRLHEGTGLGLAICKNLVSLLGGQIRAKSEWGVGSTFSFTLPLAQKGASHGAHPDH